MDEPRGRPILTVPSAALAVAVLLALLTGAGPGCRCDTADRSGAASSTSDHPTSSEARRDKLLARALTVARGASPPASRVDALTAVAEAHCAVGLAAAGQEALAGATASARSIPEKESSRALMRIARATVACGGQPGAALLALRGLRGLAEAPRLARIRALAEDACRAGAMPLLVAELVDPAPAPEGLSLVALDLAREGLIECAMSAVDAIPADGDRAQAMQRIAGTTASPGLPATLLDRAGRVQAPEHRAGVRIAAARALLRLRRNDESAAEARAALEEARRISSPELRRGSRAAALGALAAASPGEAGPLLVAEEGVVRGIGDENERAEALLGVALGFAHAGDEGAALRLAREVQGRIPPAGDDAHGLALVLAMAGDATGAVRALGGVAEPVAGLCQALAAASRYSVGLDVARSIGSVEARSGAMADVLIEQARAGGFAGVESTWNLPLDREDQTWVCVEAAREAIRAGDLSAAKRFIDRIHDPVAQAMLGGPLYVLFAEATARAGRCAEALEHVEKILQSGQKAKALAGIAGYCE